MVPFPRPVSPPVPGRRHGRAVPTLFAAVALLGWTVTGVTSRLPPAQTLPPTDAGCVAAIRPGDVRLFVNDRIPPTFRNQTPPRWNCQAEPRPMPVCNRPLGRVCFAVWAVDPASHANLAGARFTVAGVVHTTDASGLVIFLPRAGETVRLTNDRAPSAYNRLAHPYETRVTANNLLAVAEFVAR